MNPTPGGLSVGIDLVSVTQVRESLREFGDRYLQRVFTTDEITDCSEAEDPAPRFAARFAAKEATIKALKVEGTQPPWTSIQVRRDPSGWCELHLTGEAARLAQERGIEHLALSMSHEGDFATALVVATSGA
jgi:holo-[acyl-carrier protein] synthase